jgi:acetylornithine deacetylase/succinyl-diaminopimelate desuccinylase-like protein
MAHLDTVFPSDTDANYPMSLGIPAITMGAGGRGGGIHTLDEWYENEEGPEGILRALHTLLIILEEEK